MKLIIATTAAALMSTAAIADESTKYNDLRLDTSETAATVYADDLRQDVEGLSTKASDLRHSTADNEYEADTRLSTRNKISSPGQGYAYGGYGPGNDSR
jgi:hypothetical protein